MSVFDDIREEERAEILANGPYYPDIEVVLLGENGNAFNLMGKVGMALRRHGVSQDEIDLFIDEAMSGDYNYLLQTCAAWVTVS